MGDGQLRGVWGERSDSDGWGITIASGVRPCARRDCIVDGDREKKENTKKILLLF